MIDLSPFPAGAGGTGGSGALSINDHGQVAGYAHNADNQPHAFRWNGVGQPQDLSTLGGAQSRGNAINLSGEAVGDSTTSTAPNPPDHAFRASPSGVGAPVDLGTLGGTYSAARGINDAGQIVGHSAIDAGGATQHAFVWSADTGMQDLGTLGGAQAFALAVNNAGQIVGYANPADSAASHAFRWSSAAGYVDLGTLGGTDSYAQAINAAGDVAGHSQLAPPPAAARGDAPLGDLPGDSPGDPPAPPPAPAPTHAFRWSAATGTMQDLGTLAGDGAAANSFAAGMNDGGAVVGYSDVAGAPDQHAFVWDGAAMADLNALANASAAAWTLSHANDINNRGEIVGEGFHGGSAAPSAFLLRPVLSWDASGGGDFAAAGSWGTFVAPSAASDLVFDLHAAAAYAVALSAPGEAKQITIGTDRVALDLGTHVLTAKQLILANNAASAASLTLAGGGELRVLGVEQIGVGGDASLAQSAGTHHVEGALVLGNSTAARGAYALGGTGTLRVAEGLAIGVTGSGAFTQTGGTHVNDNSVFLASALGGVGTYHLSGDASLMNVALGLYVGFGGNGAFTQTAGTLNVGNDIVIARLAGSEGAFNLSGSAAVNVDWSLRVGYAGVASLTQTGGTINCAQSVIFGTFAEGRGTYELSAGALNAGGAEYLGFAGAGTFKHTGGTHQIGAGGALIIGYLPGSSGTYELGGDGQLHVAAAEAVGFHGVGTFAHTAGTHTVGDFIVGFNAGSTGGYTLGGAGRLHVAGNERLGLGGDGTLDQSGGTHTVGGALAVGVSPGAAGTLKLSGAAALDVAGAVYVGGSAQGAGGAGVATMTGGSAKVGGTLHVYDTTGTAVTLAGGTLAVDAIDLHGNPSRFAWTAGTLRYTNAGGLGVDASGPLGAALAIGDAQTLDVPRHLRVGDTGVGTFAQAGGTLAVGQTLSIGVSPGAAGTLTQTGGSQTIGEALALGVVPGAAGALTVAGSGSLEVAGAMYVGGSAQGAGGAGTATIEAGALRVGGTLHVHDTEGTNLALAGGTLAVHAADLHGNPSRFTWTGGTLRYLNAGGLALDPAGPLGATLTVDDNKALEVPHGLRVGDAGAATLTQTGGTQTIGAGLAVGVSAGGAGTFTQTGGTQTVGGPLAVGVGGGAVGAVEQSGGTRTIGGGASLGLAPGAAGSLAHSGGTQTVEGALSIGVAPGASGVLAVSGAAALHVTGAMHVGGSAAGAGGTGTANIAAGAVHVGGTIHLYDTPDTGVTFAGGTLDVDAIDTHGNPARFHWTGGALAYRDAGGLAVDAAGPIGGTVLLGAGQTLAVARDLRLGQAAAASLTVTAGGVARVGGALQIGARGTLDLAGGRLTAGADVVVIESGGTLTASNGGQLDIKDRALVARGQTSAGGAGGEPGAGRDGAGGVPASAMTRAAIEGLVRAARGVGAWDGAGIMTSVPAANPVTGGLMTLGVALAQDSQPLEASSGTAVWQGLTIGATDVLVLYTFAGDANLDGTVDGGDYAFIDAFVGAPAADVSYLHGDFNYDGAIDGGDYAYIDVTVGSTLVPPGGGGGGAGGGGAGGAGGTTALVAVPEPGCGTLMGLAAALPLRRCRRRRSPGCATADKGPRRRETTAG